MSEDSLAASDRAIADAAVRVQRLGRNLGGYFGETIDVPAVLEADLAAARRHGWEIEWLPAQADQHAREKQVSLSTSRPGGTSSTSSQPEGRLLTLRRIQPGATRRIYLSTGIHGDEPAGPLAVSQLLEENAWPAGCSFWICPCLNPAGFGLNRRGNADGIDLNRDYRHRHTAEVRVHVAWLEQQPDFDLALCLHEDWEAAGFYVYELNPDERPPLAEDIVNAVRPVCPIDESPLIEGREARGGVIRPQFDPVARAQWPEAFYLVQRKTRQSCTLEAPSDFPLALRVAALVRGVNAALAAGGRA